MIRLDDPNAAEQAAKVYIDACEAGGDNATVWRYGLQAVLDAIERPEVPRLPTRSEVAAKFLDVWGFADVPKTAAWREATSKAVRAYVDAVVELGGAVEDPEPEVDPAQVEALAVLVEQCDELDPLTTHPDFYAVMARKLLASGRVSVKVGV